MKQMNIYFLDWRLKQNQRLPTNNTEHVAECTGECRRISLALNLRFMALILRSKIGHATGNTYPHEKSVCMTSGQIS